MARQTTTSASRRILAAATAVVAMATIAACGGGSGGGGAAAPGDTSKITVSYRQFGASEVQKNFLTKVKAEFEKSHPGVTVDLQPVLAGEAEYPTKLQLAMRSTRTSPDLVYEDTFQINSDIKAGFLRPLDDRIAGWSDWANFTKTAQSAGKALDGKTYGIPDGTDTRGIWFNKNLLAQAGLPADWQPKNWDEILAAARTVKAKVPGVIPLNVYAGKGVGEASSMQGFEMLLYGTQDTLYDNASQKWITGSKGFTDALRFVDTVFKEGLGPSPQQALETTWTNKVGQELLPQSKLAIAIDGSWLTNNWLPTGASPWPDWNKVMGTAYMPTQTGQAPGKISLSGGWTWAIPNNSDNPDGAWELTKLLSDRQRQLTWAIDNVQIPVRTDVANDQTYLSANPTNGFFASLVDVTKYRPAYAVYPRISAEIQLATEKLITGSATVEQAAQGYDEQVKSIAGNDVQPAGS
ncbi:extracellular solute-binding protein [Pseudonocardia sp. CA-107938]|uniref:extracellular solute-binding protein n=1 Tax=Pseudonocardia sp. CA-107938 TaxID=3240021 RepID=UPI003D8F59BE